MKLDFDVVVIGCGPAGMTAAMYLKRSNYRVCIIEGGTPGGLMNVSSVVENYPGVKKTTGPELAFSMYEQIMQLNIPLKNEKVIEIINKKTKKIVKTDKGKVSCKAVIIASGREPRKLRAENAKALTGKGISYCALCDGALYKGNDVAIVGGGNSALEESLFLANICNKVYLIHRRDELTGDDVTIDQVKKKKNIEIIYNAEIKEFNANNGILESIDVLRNKEIINLKVAAIFVFIGYKPATDFLENLDILDSRGYIVVDDKKKTKVDGIYAAGDIIYKEAFQIVVAASDGALAAVNCMRDLEK